MMGKGGKEGTKQNKKSRGEKIYSIHLARANPSSSLLNLPHPPLYPPPHHPPTHAKLKKRENR